MYFWHQIILWNSESANVWFVVRMVVSVTRLGDFWKFLATKFLAKEVQIIGKFLGYFEKPLMKKCIGYFLHIFWKKLGYFLLQHLSHWWY